MPTNEQEIADVQGGSTGHTPTPTKPPPSPPPPEQFLRFANNLIFIAAISYIVILLLNKLFSLNQDGFSNLQPAGGFSKRSQQL